MSTVRESNADRAHGDARPAGVAFDNDGLLLDTEPCWTRAQRAVFERRGRAFDLARAVALEDSPPGVAAARAAGLLVVGVPSVEGVELAADVVAPSLGDPRVRAALGLTASREPAA
jgi:beta-phosphoglucomutase-like phosphatase (HAD superfamily)